MRADNKGEGGIFALLALAPERLRNAGKARVTALALMAILGSALLYGDGVITPAISVLSAVEGLIVVNPAVTAWVVPATALILLGLFAIQSRGTGTVGKLFGPIMILWFATLATLGIYHIASYPAVLAALSPMYGINHLIHHGWHGFTLLTSVVLAVTGGEALYADMGHFGAKPIRLAWVGLVMPALVLNYFGQGALVLSAGAHPPENPFFAMTPAGPMTLALVILSSMAAVIASQALISGAFSLTQQAMQLGYMPRFEVRHTAAQMEGQIYMPEVNFFLAVGSILLVLAFRSSSNLAAAYGIAVTGTMAITSMMYYVIATETWGWPKWKGAAVLLLFLSFDLPFLAANLTKFVAGGYVPIMIAVVLGTLMVIWRRGRAILSELNLRRFPNKDAVEKEIDRSLAVRVPGTAVFLSSNPATIPAIMPYYVSHCRSLHEHVIIATVVFTNEPRVAEEKRYAVTRDICDTWRVRLDYGFMEEPRIVPALERACADNSIPFDGRHAVYFLGRENFVASDRGQMGANEERIFAFMNRNTSGADAFFSLPSRQVIEIGTQIDL